LRRKSQNTPSKNFWIRPCLRIYIKDNFYWTSFGVVHLLRYAKKRNFSPPLVTNFPRKIFFFVWPVTKSQTPPSPLKSEFVNDPKQKNTKYKVIAALLYLKHMTKIKHKIKKGK